MCLTQLFKRIVEQYKQLWKRNAFLENYKKEPIFKDSMDEFEDSREVVQDLIDEYQAAEKENYPEWGSNMDIAEM